MLRGSGESQRLHPRGRAAHGRYGLTRGCMGLPNLRRDPATADKSKSHPRTSRRDIRFANGSASRDKPEVRMKSGRAAFSRTVGSEKDSGASAPEGNRPTASEDAELQMRTSRVEVRPFLDRVRLAVIPASGIAPSQPMEFISASDGPLCRDGSMVSARE
jgi:hypothetical protein